MWGVVGWFGFGERLGQDFFWQFFSYNSNAWTLNNPVSNGCFFLKQPLKGGAGGMDFGAKNGVILRSGFFGWIKHLDTSDMDYKKWDVSNLRGGWNSNSSSFLGRFISIYIYIHLFPLLFGDTSRDFSVEIWHPNRLRISKDWLRSQRVLNLPLRFT